MKWVWLDSCSTDSCTNNPQFIYKIKNGEKNGDLKIHTNDGEINFKKKGMFKMLPVTMFYNPE